MDSFKNDIRQELLTFMLMSVWLLPSPRVSRFIAFAPVIHQSIVSSVRTLCAERNVVHDSGITGGFEIRLELVVKCRAKGGKIVEVPTTWRDRVADKSNFKLWKWLPKYLKWFFMAFK